MIIDISTGRISIIQDEIVKLEFTPNVKINLEQAKEIFQARLQLIACNKQFVLTDLRTVPVPDIHARNYTQSNEVTNITHGMAILIGSPMSKILGNFFFGINKAKFPTKLFTCQDTAIDWLKKLKETVDSNEKGLATVETQINE